MKTTVFLSLILSLAFSMVISTPTNLSADPIDCEELVEECLLENPYIFFISPAAREGFVSGCVAAGEVCEEMQE